jgi:hypothetical protein
MMTTVEVCPVNYKFYKGLSNSHFLWRIPRRPHIPVSSRPIYFILLNNGWKSSIVPHISCYGQPYNM